MMKFRSFMGLIMAVVVLLIGLASTSGCSTAKSQESPVNQPTANPITKSGSSSNYSPNKPNNMKGNDNSTKTEFTAEELAVKLASGENLVIIDVNPLEQYREGHIKGAMQGDIRSLRRAPETYLNQLGINKTDTIVLVCETGNRSAITLPFLVNAGYSTVYNLKDGNLGWLRAGFTLIRE